jgi:hypothetical protein
VQAAVENIMKSGGSDEIVEEVLRSIDQSAELKSAIDSVGVRESRVPFDRVTVSVASINSIMLARRDLLLEPDSSGAKQRLADSQRAFRYSFLLFSEQESAAELERLSQGVMLMLSGKPRPPGLYEERTKQAEEAAETWMRADISKHAFI